MNGTYRSRDHQERSTASGAQDVESVAHTERDSDRGGRSLETSKPWLAEDARRLGELSAALAELQAELSAVRGSLARRYQPELEARGQRLMIERDEALMVWGQLILGLCDLGGELRLEWPPGVEERDRSETLIWSAELAAQLALSTSSPSNADDHPSLDSDERTIGLSRWDAHTREISQSFTGVEQSSGVSNGVSSGMNGGVSGDSPLRQVIEPLDNSSTSHAMNPAKVAHTNSKLEDQSSQDMRSDAEAAVQPNVTVTSDVLRGDADSSHVSSSPASTDSAINTSDVSDLDIKDNSVASPVGEADAPKVSLTHFSLDDLRKNMKPSWGHDGISDEPLESNEYAVELLKRIGPPRDFTQLKEHLIELEEEVECCQRWSNFTQGVQHGVVTLITSRLRGIQELLSENAFDQDRIAKMFRRLTRFSSDFRPGFVHGLSREKIPEHDNWRVDEVYAWRRLEKLLKLPPQLPPISPTASEKLERLKELLKREDEIDDFSNELRRAVTECLNGGLSPESPHLTRLLTDQLSHLSGKRFKKLRSAVSSPTM